MALGGGGGGAAAAAAIREILLRAPEAALAVGPA
jgi:hypothetical protein